MRHLREVDRTRRVRALGIQSERVHVDLLPVEHLAKVREGRRRVVSRIRDAGRRERLGCVAVQHGHEAVHQVAALDARTRKRGVALLTVQTQLEVFDIKIVRSLRARRLMRAVRLDLLQVRLDVRVRAATLVREVVLRRRALVHEVGGGTGLSARSHVTPLTNRDDKLLHRVQEAEVDLEGAVFARGRCTVSDLKGGRLVMPQLHEAHVLLVHERRGLGPRDVHVVAPQLGRLDGFGKLRQRMHGTGDIRNKSDRRVGHS